MERDLPLVRGVAVNSTVQETTPIHFPILQTSGDCLLRIRRSEFVRFQVTKKLEGNRYILKSAASPRIAMSWLIDRDGFVRDVRPIRKRRSFLAPLAWLVDLVQLECEILPGRRMIIAELLIKLADLKAPNGFQTAGHLRGYLSRKPGNAVFDCVMFREFWDLHGPELNEQLWTEEFP